MIDIVLRWSRNGLQALRLAMHRVAFSVAGPLRGRSTVVVDRSPPEHATMGHHAFAQLEHFVGMTLPASDVSNSQIPWVHETNEFGAFIIQQRIGSHRIGRCRPKRRILGLYVGALFGEVVWITTMTVGTADVHGVGWMHIANIAMALDA